MNIGYLNLTGLPSKSKPRKHLESRDVFFKVLFVGIGAEAGGLAFQVFSRGGPGGPNLRVYFYINISA